jgi:IS1 family transposase
MVGLLKYIPRTDPCYNCEAAWISGPFTKFEDGVSYAVLGKSCYETCSRLKEWLKRQNSDLGKER